MRIFQKARDIAHLLCSPDEMDFCVGDYLVAGGGDNSLLLQVLDVSYADVPGVLEDILRDLSAEQTDGRSLFDPYNVSSLSLLMREIRAVEAKVRGVISSGKLRTDTVWLPDRFSSPIRRADADTLMSLTAQMGHRAISLGKVGEEEFSIQAESLDGGLTIITGKKESGKSHMAKILLEGLISHGATVVVLDLNGEYLNLNRTKSGEKSAIEKALRILEPGVNFRVSPEQVGLRCFMDVLEHVYGTPPTSCREFARIWHVLEREESRVTLRSLINMINRSPMHEAVREALMSRVMSIEASSFVCDDGTTDLQSLLGRDSEGSLVVLNLRNLQQTTRRLVVEFLLSTLSNLLRADLVRPLFLLAEEAHLYLRETYWDDIVTRMRHLGLFPIFVTNQPDSIPDSVYRQADNVFLFNFSNEADLEKVSKASRVDGESIRTLGRSLPPRRCLLVGRMVGDIPVVVKVRDSNLQTMGQTKLIFKDKELVAQVSS